MSFGYFNDQTSTWRVAGRVGTEGGRDDDGKHIPVGIVDARCGVAQGINAVGWGVKF
jgi:hypothetical protein